MSARCTYCDAGLRPNSMYCLECGQLASVPVAAPRASAPAGGVPLAPPFPGHQTAQAPAPATAQAPAPTKTPAAPATTQQAAPQATPAQQPSVSHATMTSYPEPATLAASRARSAVTLLFSTGDRVSVQGTALIGRQPTQAAQNSGAQGISILDTTRSVSRVHLSLTVGPRDITVTDAGSGNGSRIERGGSITPCIEGKPAVVAPGDRVWLGEVYFDLAHE